MKKIFLTLLCSLFFIQLNAQSKSNNLNNLQKFKLIVAQSLSQQVLHAFPKYTAGQKTTIGFERVKAISDYNLTDTIFHHIGIIDSVRYIYSGGGSIFDFNGMGYNSAWLMAAGIPYGYGTNVAKIAHDNQPAVFYDTSLIYNDYYGTYAFADTRYAVYDSNYNITNYCDLYTQDSSLSYYDNRYSNTFDAWANITNTYAFNWDFGYVDSSEKRTFIYDTNHKVIQDSCLGYSFGLWSPSYKWLYTYNSYGKIAAAYGFIYNYATYVWDSNEVFIYTYNLDTTLQTLTMKGLNSTGLITTYFTDSLGYNLTAGYANYEKQKNFDFYNSGNLISYIIITKHINSSYLPDTTYTTQYDSLNNIISGNKTLYTYDAFNNPTTALSYNIDTFSHPWTYNNTIDKITHYYYEGFTPGASWVRHLGTANVDIVKSQIENINIYPNPSKDDFFIKTDNIKKGTFVRIDVINANGQIIKTEMLAWMNEVEKISLADLASGTYWIAIEDKNDNIVYKKSIIKL